MIWKFVKRWGVLVITLAWAIPEVWWSVDHDDTSRSLTQTIIESVPWWVYVPAAIALAAWIPPHFIEHARRKRQATAAIRSLSSLAGDNVWLPREVVSEPRCTVCLQEPRNDCQHFIGRGVDMSPEAARWLPGGSKLAPGADPKPERKS